MSLKRSAEIEQQRQTISLRGNLMSNVRAKFKVISITRQAGWNGAKEVHTVKLSPVSSGSDENKAFYAATPGGSIDLSVVNEEVGREFDIGAEFYVDFTKAE